MIRLARPTRGFTLVEALVSSALVGVLLIAMGSAILLSRQALPSANHAAYGRLAAATAMEQLSDDLAHVLFLTERSDHAVTLIVPDRTGDGRSERIRYAWSGEAGDPLTRRLNDAEPHVLVERVAAFELDYVLGEHERSYGGPLIESAEQQLASFTDLGVDEGRSVDASRWAGQYITPALPADTLWWRPTRVAFRALRRDGGPLWVRVHLANPDKQAQHTVVAHGAINASTFNALLYSWEELEFAAAERIRPDQPVALAFRNDGSANRPAYIGYQLLGSDRLVTTDAGHTWSHRSLQSHTYRLWGEITRRGPGGTARFEQVIAVAARLAAADEPDVPVRIQAHLRNEPDVVAAAWKLNFRTHPESVDLMASGAPDWQAAQGQVSFDEEADGRWLADGELQTRPLHDFDTVTRVELRMRHHGSGGEGAGFRIFADRHGGQAAELHAALVRRGDGSQTLTLQNPGHHEPLLAEIPNLPDAFIHIALLIDPRAGVVHMEVEGQSHDTFAYQRRSVNAGERHAAIFGDHGEAEFDLVRIRVNP